MSKLQVPDFTSYEDEAKFWDELDTRDLLQDDGEWFHFETLAPRAFSLAFPDAPARGQVLRPDLELPLERLAALSFDPNAAVLLALDSLPPP